MKKSLFLIYGFAAYGIFFATYCYAVGFVTNLVVPTGLDSGPTSSLAYSLGINIGMLLLFSLQHSIMARPAFKKWWTRIVPEPIERSTYVLFSSLCLILIFWQWEPIGGVVWSVDSTAGRMILNGISLLGFGIVLISTFLINHFDLFGLRQVWLYFVGRKYEHLPFKTPFFYKYVRHPLYIGWMIAFWAAPVMTIAHFLFAALCTGYMLTAIRLEERDLIQVFGDQYIRYKKLVPMLIPFKRRNDTDKPIR
jgi:protein-S-isoprenylcysteine O-methyltransferase Ste14